MGPVAAADNLNASTSSATQPVFLLSERNLGTGFKICFLSNGLQMRMPATQVCPYPLKAPPLADEKPTPVTAPQAPAPAQAGFSSNPIKAETVTEPTKLPQQSAQQQPQRQTAPPVSVAQKLPEPPKPAVQPTPPATTPQPIAARSTPIESKPQNTAAAPVSTQVSDDDDLIADKAIRRCERIGFKAGTELFKSCALEQIRILSGVKP